MGIGDVAASDFLSLLRPVGTTQFDRHPPFHSRTRSSERRRWHPMFGTVSNDFAISRSLRHRYSFSLTAQPGVEGRGAGLPRHVRDVSRRGDQARIHVGNAPRVRAVTRNTPGGLKIVEAFERFAEHRGDAIAAIPQRRTK